MIEQKILNHRIQKHVIDVLMHQKYARFRDMRPPRVDTNLYSYHLKLLQKNDFVAKTEKGYTLSKTGLIFVDRVSTKSLKIRTQPKIITILVVQNSNGDVLLFKRKRQPYVDLWTLPYGKLHIDDETILSAAQREASEKLNLKDQEMSHAGECYIRIKSEDEIIMSTFAHVFYFETDKIQESESLVWARPHRLSQYDLAPAVEQIVARTFFRDPYFFEEYSEDLVE